MGPTRTSKEQKRPTAKNKAQATSNTTKAPILVNGFIRFGSKQTAAAHVVIAAAVTEIPSSPSAVRVRSYRDDVSGASLYATARCAA